ncbi:DUF6153 family protein [Streptomyces indiaensis]|uniref:DUF6153 family protein n=1 Tax=Streptomyces indiaensis TaxID=284033 RepID=UPI0027E28A19|nr:DUF6153 family protein [Streptomyces indiaensis]
MNSPRRRAPRLVLRPWHVLGVLGLLAGLLGMHGLAPGGGLPGAAHGQHMDALTVRTQFVPYAHCGDGHVQHADATCASGAVSGGPVLPPLVPDPVPAAVRESAVRVYAVVDTEGARAPPSLSELQLLRI